MNELKPCPVPWCEGKGEIERYLPNNMGWGKDKFRVECNRCDCRSDSFDTPEEAAAQWNTRAEPVSVDERLPEVPCEVLAFGEVWDNWSMSWRREWLKTYYDETDEEPFGHGIRNVTYWLPMPPAPK